MQGRGIDRYHRRVVDEDGIPRVSMDYMFITEYGVVNDLEEAEKLNAKHGDLARTCMTVLVLKDFRSKSVWAYPVEGKGVAASEWLITQVLEDLDTCGLDGCRIILKSDQEPSILEVQNRIAELRRQAHSHGTGIENSRVGDSNSNARVERAIQEVGGLARTMKAGLESRLGIQIRLDHPTVPWIVKHAASTLTKYLVRDCGNTSFKIIKGRTCIEPAGEFGEMVLFKPLATAAKKANK